MLLKKVGTEFAIFETDDPNKDLESILHEDCERHPDGPCNDPVGIEQSMVNE